MDSTLDIADSTLQFQGLLTWSTCICNLLLSHIFPPKNNKSASLHRKKIKRLRTSPKLTCPSKSAIMPSWLKNIGEEPLWNQLFDLFFLDHKHNTEQTLPTCFQRYSARSTSICIFVVSMNIWSETPIIDLVLKVEIGCPQNDSVKNGCQGATMGPLLCSDLWILRLV